MITIAQKLGRPECPYMVRWVINFHFFSIRLHHWIASDDQRNFHDHPWWFWSFVLKGSYVDRTTEGVNVRNNNSFKFFPALHQHTVIVPKSGCWTLLLTGREKRTWGFWVNGRFRKRNRYFYDFQHHPCE